MSRSTRQPWATDSYGQCRRPKLKRIHERRYRRNVRQDVKQWNRMYYYQDGLYNFYASDFLDEFWDNDTEVLFWRAFLA